MLIGISEYKDHVDRKLRWNPLHTETDLELVRNALIAKGFKNDGIKLLKNNSATKAGIVASISELVLATQPGTTAVIHFSGHGQRIADYNHDEIDGLDEAIVPYDAPSRYISGKYEGDLHLSDDELNNLLIPLRKKLTKKGTLLVILDSCYSGSGLRGNQGPSHRGGLSVIASKDYLNELSNTQFKRDITVNFSSEIDSLSDVIGIYGSSSNEPNSERYTEEDNRRIVGSLSYSFSKCLLNSENDLTYNGLFKRIKFDMASDKFARNQNPYIEGNLNKILFSGYSNQTINRIQIISSKDSIIEIDRGRLSGITTGSEIGFFKDSQDTIPLYRATVRSSSVDRSSLILSDDVLKEDILNSYISVMNYNYNHSTLIKIDDTIINKDRDNITENIKNSYAYIESELNSDLVLTKSKDQYELSLSNGQLQHKTNSIEAIWNYLKKYYTANMLRGLQSKARQFDASLTFEFGQYQNSGIFEFDSVQIVSDEKDTYNITSDDTFRFAITNETNRDLYFLLLTIYPDNTIVSLFPYFDSKNGGYIYPGETPNESLILAKGTVSSPVDYSVAPPFGEECYKLITSDKPIDISPILFQINNLQTRGKIDLPHVSNPIDLLMAELFIDAQVTTRSTYRNTLEKNEVNVSTLYVNTSK